MSVSTLFPASTFPALMDTPETHLELDQIQKECSVLKEVHDAMVSLENRNTLGITETARMISLVPNATSGLGVESSITFEESELNYQIATEALTTGGKALVGTIVAAVLALVIRYFKVSKTKTFETGGFGGTQRGSKASFKKGEEEIRQSYPIFESEVDRFRELMKNFKGGKAALLDGDVSGLSSKITPLLQAARKFTYNSLPTYDRETDQAKIGHILLAISEELEPGFIFYNNFPPFNFLLDRSTQMTQRMIFMDKFALFMRDNDVLSQVYPATLTALWDINLEPEYYKNYFGDFKDLEPLRDFYEILNNQMGIPQLAKVLGIEPRNDAIATFYYIVTAVTTQNDAIFGTSYNNLADQRDDPAAMKAVKDYYYFLTTGGNNDSSKLVDRSIELSEQCSILMGTSKKHSRDSSLILDSMNKSERIIERIHGNNHDISKINTPNTGKMNTALLQINQFLTNMSRLIGIITKIIISVEKLETSLHSLKTDQEKLTKILIDVNSALEEQLK